MDPFSCKAMPMITIEGMTIDTIKAIFSYLCEQKTALPAFIVKINNTYIVLTNTWCLLLYPEKIFTPTAKFSTFNSGDYVIQKQTYRAKTLIRSSRVTTTPDVLSNDVQ